MSWEGWATLAVIVLVIVALIRNVASVDAVLLAGVTVLTVLGVFSERLLSPADVAGSFGNEAVLVIGVLFVVAAGVTETGAAAMVTERLLGRRGDGRVAQVRVMLPTAAASAVLPNTAVVAMLVSPITEWVRRTGVNPAHVFIPLSYAAVLGGICTLIGTSTNLVVQGLLIEAELPTMGMFTITAVGLPAALVGLAFILVASPWLLPGRPTDEEAPVDPREYTVEMMVEPGSPIVGRTIEEAGLRHLRGLYLAHVERDGEILVAVAPSERLQAHDRLMFVGLISSVVDLQRTRGLRPATDQVFKLTDERPNRHLVEAVVSPTFPLIGTTIREGRFRSRYDAVVIAVRRHGERIASKIGDIVLQPGDTLLLETHPRFLDAHRNSADFFLVSGVADSEPRRFNRAWVALSILVGTVVVVGLSDVTGIGLLPGALLAALLMLLTRCCSWEQARRRIDWGLLIAIGSGIAIGQAFAASGAADAVGGVITGGLGPFGPVAVLAGIYLATLLLTEAVSNSAAAVLMFPIAVSTAGQLDASVMPFAICIAIAASSGFASPLGYQTHLMVQTAGGYTFSDFLRAGVPLDLVVMATAVTLIPIFFPF